MFDPTAFENIKVVIEGDIYDRDLSGEIVVTDRNDWINTAKMSRRYEISFSLLGSENSGISAVMMIEAGLENLSAELFRHKNAEELAGCSVSIGFTISHQNDQSIYFEIQQALENIWGKDRAIEQIVRTVPLKDNFQIENLITIGFNRLVYEDQIDDLSNMVDYMIDSLERLKAIIKK